MIYFVNDDCGFIWTLEDVLEAIFGDFQVRTHLRQHSHSNQLRLNCASYLQVDVAAVTQQQHPVVRSHPLVTDSMASYDCREMLPAPINRKLIRANDRAITAILGKSPPANVRIFLAATCSGTRVATERAVNHKLADHLMQYREHDRIGYFR